jgi:hypothetical protein
LRDGGVQVAFFAEIRRAWRTRNTYLPVDDDPAASDHTSISGAAPALSGLVVPASFTCLDANAWNLFATADFELATSDFDAGGSTSSRRWPAHDHPVLDCHFHVKQQVDVQEHIEHVHEHQQSTTSNGGR